MEDLVAELDTVVPSQVVPVSLVKVITVVLL
jgi:hypothetical protein